MSISYMDYTSPNVQFTYDLKNNPFFKKDNQNYINVLSINQLNTLGDNSLLDIFLSNGGTVEPHYHQNASELVYCIAGSAVVSLINPFTSQLLHFPIRPGQVANVPQGWWHYEIATRDNTHLLAVFDAPIPEVIFGSDILRLTPANVLADTYCLNEAEVKETLAPITSTVIVGPPKDCKPTGPSSSSNNQKRSTPPTQTVQFQQVPGSTQQHAERARSQWSQPNQANGVPELSQPVTPRFPSPYQTMPQQMQTYPISVRPGWTVMASSYPAYGNPQAGQQSQQAAPPPFPTYPGLPMQSFPR